MLAGRFGWRFTARAYGVACIGFALVWQLFTSSHPPPLAGPTAAAEEEKDKAAEPAPDSAAGLQEEPPVAAKVSMLRLLLTPPQQSCMWLQVTHDLVEFQTLGSWVPTYLNQVLAWPATVTVGRPTAIEIATVCLQLNTFLSQVLGVPLGSVGMYTVWPMLTSLCGKFAITAWESRMIKGGIDRLQLRKLSTAIATSCYVGFVTMFTVAPSPVLATVAYCGVTAGGCFDYPGFTANLLEVQGDDSMMLEAYSNPSAWFLVFVFGTLFPRLRALTGSWYVLFLGPLAVRLAGQLYYQKVATIGTARAHYERYLLSKQR